MVKNLLGKMMQEAKTLKGKLDSKRFVEELEKGYLSKSAPAFKTKKSVAPSSLVYGSGECPRYWYLAFDGATYVEDNTPAQIANMRNGSKAHERIQEAAQNTDMFVSAETKIIYNDPPIFGFLDLMVDWDGEKIPVEIKTCNTDAFQRRKDAKTALPYHRAQLLIYMYIEDKPKGIVLYENKNTHELYPVVLEMTDENRQWVESAFEWMRQVRAEWSSGTLPVKPYRSNSKICKTCPLKAVCDDAGPGSVKLPTMEQLA